MMEKLQCTCCGGKLVMNANGNAVCQFCGMEYAPEAMKKLIVEMKGTVPPTHWPNVPRPSSHWGNAAMRG